MDVVSDDLDGDISFCGACMICGEISEVNACAATKLSSGTPIVAKLQLWRRLQPERFSSVLGMSLGSEEMLFCPACVCLVTTADRLECELEETYTSLSRRLKSSTGSLEPFDCVELRIKSENYDDDVSIPEEKNNSVTPPPCARRQLRRRTSNVDKESCDDYERLVRRKRGRPKKIHSKESSKSKNKSRVDCHSSAEDDDVDLDSKPSKNKNFEDLFAVCEICGVVARGPAAKGKINYHVTAVHKKVKKFKCPICDEAFEHHGSRRRHLARVHQVGVEGFQFTCELCGQFFESKRDLERHKFSKHNILMRDVQVYACTQCNKQFIKKQAYEGHVRLHSGIKPHTCPTCDYSSTLFGALKRHLLVAHGRHVKRVFVPGCTDETIYNLVDVGPEEKVTKKKRRKQISADECNYLNLNCSTEVQSNAIM